MELLTAAEVASQLRIGLTTVYEMVRSGRLRAIRVGRGASGIRVPAACLQEFVLGQLATTQDQEVDETRPAKGRPRGRKNRSRLFIRPPD